MSDRSLFHKVKDAPSFILHTTGARYFAAAGIFLLTALLVRLKGFTESLWFDEVLYASHLTLKDPVFFFKMLFYDCHPPFYLLWMVFWTRFFGDAEWVVRLPSLLWGLGSLFLAYRLLRLWVSRSGALWTACWLALSPVHIWYCREARPYTLQLFLALGTFWFYERLNKRSDFRYLVLYGACALLMVFTHYYLLLYLGLISVLALLERGRSWGRVLTVNASVLICFGLYFALQNFFSPLPMRVFFLRPFTFPELWVLLMSWFLTGNALWGINLPPWELAAILFHQPGVVVFQGIFFLYFLWGFWSIFKRNKIHALKTASALIIIPVFLLIMAALGFRHLYIERSAFTALPFFLVMAAEGVRTVPGRFLRGVGVLLLWTVIFGSLGMFFARQEEWMVYKPRPDWRSAADYFRDEIRQSRQESAVIVVTSPALALTHYEPGISDRWYGMRELRSYEDFVGKAEKLIGREAPVSGILRERLAQERKKISEEKSDGWSLHYASPHLLRTLARKKTETYYFLTNRYWAGDQELRRQVLLELIGLGYRFAGRKTFKGIEILKYQAGR